MTTTFKKHTFLTSLVVTFLMGNAAAYGTAEPQYGMMFLSGKNKPNGSRDYELRVVDRDIPFNQLLTWIEKRDDMVHFGFLEEKDGKLGHNEGLYSVSDSETNTLNSRQINEERDRLKDSNKDIREKLLKPENADILKELRKSAQPVLTLDKKGNIQEKKLEEIGLSGNDYPIYIIILVLGVLGFLGYGLYWFQSQAKKDQEERSS